MALGFLYDHGHEAVETEHAGAKADVRAVLRRGKAKDTPACLPPRGSVDSHSG